jgi:hypothetical protein
LFRVSTLDLTNLPRTPDGKVDFAQDFFGLRRSHLRTVASKIRRVKQRLFRTCDQSEGCSCDEPLNRSAASDYGGRQNNDRRCDFDCETEKQRPRVGPFCTLELSNQGWSEGEAELVDCNDEADDPGEMLLRELLLNDEARQ